MDATTELETLETDSLSTRFEIRARLQEFCRPHFRSVRAFRAPKHDSFRVTESETFECEPLSVRHLSTTATCIESLLACPVEKDDREALEKLARGFAARALERPTDKWLSEGSAPVYCCVRTLPIVMSYASEGCEAKIRELLLTVLQQTRELGRFGFGETTGNHDKVSDRAIYFPPTAYHTYWTLLCLERFQSKFLNATSIGDFQLDVVIAGAKFWSLGQLGYEIALHAARSPRRNTDQLVWSLACLLRFEAALPAAMDKQDLVRHALHHVFTELDHTGSWPHRKALFHYREAGNAYCYVFETFAIVLRDALRVDSELIREMLRPHLRRLTGLIDYADSTRIRLEEPGASGWASGHRADRTDAEAWATASVYSFAQYLRVTYGHSTRAATLAALRRGGQARTRLTSEEARKQLVRRGDCWDMSAGELSPGGGAGISPSESVADLLLSLYVNPVLAQTDVSEQGVPRAESSLRDPDFEVISEGQARSAILFGPPGTSKTTLAQCVADIVEWEYLEIHASDFVADGLGEVQKTADRLFRQLMELDRTVVLFDEADELVRRRDGETDAFGRFLTTSMLPKLAELWKRRRVIYFVATNHLEYFDEAIIRSQRFDALIPIFPPSFDAKCQRVNQLLAESYGLQGVTWSVPLTDVHAVLREAWASAEHDAAGIDSPLGDARSLAKLVYLRWDQMHELAARLVGELSKEVMPAVISRIVLEKALRSMGDDRLNALGPYARLERDRRRARRDYQMRRIWELREVGGEFPTGAVLGARRLKGKQHVWLSCEGGTETLLMHLDSSVPGSRSFTGPPP